MPQSKSSNDKLPSVSSAPLDAVFWFVLTLGALLRFYGLNRTLGTTGVGGFDEGVDLRHVWPTPLSEILSIFYIPTPSPPGLSHHIFHSTLVHFMISIFGENCEWAVRFPAFVSGILTLWLSYHLANRLFASLPIARITLLLFSLNPIHIAYSQTARGYSLIILFSSVICLSVVNYLYSDRRKIWGGIIFIAGVLALCTMLPSGFLFIGLAVWSFIWLLQLNAFVTEKVKVNSRKRIIELLTLFALIGLVVLFLIYPLLDQIKEASQGHFNILFGINNGVSSPLIILGILPKLMSTIFPGATIILIPFFIFGVLRSNPVPAAGRWIPLIVLISPFLISLLTGVASYARTYLFNIPLILIFTSAGVFEFIRVLGLRLVPVKNQVWLSGVLLLVHAWPLFIKYYPSLQTFSGNQYKQNLQLHSPDHGLLFFTKAKQYIYGKSTYRKNIENIIYHNRLDNIGFVKSPSFNVNNVTVIGQKGRDFKLLNKDSFHKSFSQFTLVDDFQLANLNPTSVKAILPEDFEFLANWVPYAGTGKVVKNNSAKIEGKSSLNLTNLGQGPFMVRSKDLLKVKVVKDSLIVLIWTSLNIQNSDSSPQRVLYRGNSLPPTLYLMPTETLSKLKEIPMGLFNPNLNAFIDSPTSHDFKGNRRWYINGRIGNIPKGSYLLHIALGAGPEENVLLDGLRIFILEF